MRLTGVEKGADTNERRSRSSFAGTGTMMPVVLKEKAYTDILSIMARNREKGDGSEARFEKELDQAIAYIREQPTVYRLRRPPYPLRAHAAAPVLPGVRGGQRPDRDPPRPPHASTGAEALRRAIAAEHTHARERIHCAR